MRRSVGAVLAAVAITGTSGCGWFGPDDHVALLGDSITDQSRERLHDGLGESYRIDVRATPGVEISEMVDEARLTMRRPPDQVIVNLGTNDVLNELPPEDSATVLEVLLDQLDEVPCVHLVTINELMVSLEDEGLGQRAASLNEHIRRIAEERGYEVIDWTAALEGATDEPGAEGLLTDTVHLTDEGERLLVNVYEDAVSSGC